MNTNPLLLTKCRIDREVSVEVFVYGIPTVKGMDKLIDILITLRNSWRELNDEPPYVNYDSAALQPKAETGGSRGNDDGRG